MAHGGGVTVRGAHPLFSRAFDRISRSMEGRGLGEQRARLLTGLSGRVVEIGAGNGLSFAHYPPEVTTVIAVEPEPYLRRRAEEAARRAPVPVEIVDAVAGDLPLPDGAVDAGVASLVLCSVPEQAASLGELHRVIRPGGQLRFFEHVRATTPVLARVQDVLDATLWPRMAAGCHTGRDTVTAIEAAGFVVEHLERLRFPDGAALVPTAAHAMGIARRPTDATGRQARDKGRPGQR